MEMPYPSFFLRPLAFTYFLDVSSPWNWGASLGPAFRPNESRLQAPSVLQDARASPLLAASGRPQCVWATFRLPAHRLVGVWVVSALWLLGVMMLWVWVLWACAFSALGRGVELRGRIVTLCCPFWGNSQTLPTGAVPFSIPTSKALGTHFPYILTDICRFPF